jgi:hypothetical protein
VSIYKERLLGIVKQRWEAIALVVILLLAVPAIVWLPERSVNQVYHGDRKRSIESGNNYAKLVDDYRKTVTQIIGGAFLLYGLYLTQRRTKATEETLRVSQRTLEVTRETQVTDRFTKAITQLGATDSQGKKQLEIRFGGIYALERIAKDSPDDHWPIMEILTAYVRENAPCELWIELESEDSRTPEEIPQRYKIPQFPHPDKDIQAIMTVIGRSKREQDKGRLDLISVDLRRAGLQGAHLEMAQFGEANLERAHLEGAHLAGADFFVADLKRANLEGAHLEGANLGGAHLEGANLEGAYLEPAYLGEAHLEGANLAGAHLEGANLEGADFSTAVALTQEQINVAYGDYTTKLPPGLTYPEHWPKAPNEQGSTA